MATSVPGRSWLVRVARLPRQPTGSDRAAGGDSASGAEALAPLAVWWRHRLLELHASPQLLAGIAPGDLIEITLAPDSPSLDSPALDAPGTPAAPRAASLKRVGGPQPGAAWEAGDVLRWRHPGDAVPRLKLLELRHQVLRALRDTLDGVGCIEVETPALVPAPSPEPQFAPLAAGGGWLITSPEFQLKRLLVGGAERIYRLGPVFRGGEQGRQHAPEFTLLEWYRVGVDTAAMAGDLLALLRAVAPLAERYASELPAAELPAAELPASQPPAKEMAAAQPALAGPASAPAPRLRAAWLQAPLPQVAVAELFRRHLGLEIGGVTTAGGLRRAARAAGLPAPEGPFDAAFAELWVRLEPHFGPEPFLAVDWPAPVASLARLKPGDPSLAERMELYAGGLELANGFAELTDAAEQRRRFLAQLQQRREQGLPALPLDERFLTALEHGLPPSAGMALGVDRLVMLVAGAADIRLVLPFAPGEI